MRLKLSITFLAIVFSLQNIYPQNSTARFLLWHPSAISNSMGGVGTALYDNAYAAYYNPACLAFSERLTLVGSLVKPLPFFGNITHSFMGASVRTRRIGTFGFSTNLIWKGIQLASSGDYTADGYTVNWQGKISYAAPVTSRFSIGLSLSLLRMKLSEDFYFAGQKRNGETLTPLFDVGSLLKDLFPEFTLTSKMPKEDKWFYGKKKEGISVGIALLNLGPKISFINEDQSDNTPAKFVLGGSYCPAFLNEGFVILAVDFEKRLYEASIVDYVHLGAEVNVLHLLSLRLGRFADAKEPETSYNTYGAGIGLKYFSVNIARYEMSLLPTWHYDATFSLEF